MNRLFESMASKSLQVSLLSVQYYGSLFRRASRRQKHMIRFNFCFEQNTNILKKIIINPELKEIVNTLTDELQHYKSKESFKLKKQNKNTLV